MTRHVLDDRTTALLETYPDGEPHWSGMPVGIEFEREGWLIVVSTDTSGTPGMDWTIGIYVPEQYLTGINLEAGEFDLIDVADADLMETLAYLVAFARPPVQFVRLDSVQVPHEARHDPGTRPEECLLCGRGLTRAQADKGWWVHLVDGGGDIAPRDYEGGDPRGDVGWFPVGSDCAKRVPVGYRHRGRP